jgi:hypothetical protein
MATKCPGQAVKARQPQSLALLLDPSPPGDQREGATLQKSEANFHLALQDTPITLAQGPQKEARNRVLAQKHKRRLAQGEGRLF